MVRIIFYSWLVSWEHAYAYSGSVGDLSLCIVRRQIYPVYSRLYGRLRLTMAHFELVELQVASLGRVMAVYSMTVTAQRNESLMLSAAVTSFVPRSF